MGGGGGNLRGWSPGGPIQGVLQSRGSQKLTSGADPSSLTAKGTGYVGQTKEPGTEFCKRKEMSQAVAAPVTEIEG